ncbi:hypothetical protein BHS06_28860 [Myxococcus xanthus]|uniref:hypothetical protein n=1 Tax=Myxococcus xanthus TaxID=34 RepID=UPI00112ACA63|nr:hypothetical protein [Myxococcus xanthus]QDE92671.1 hypothetical protein BHS06_28860 [Myxococcus xanthus]
MSGNPSTLFCQSNPSFSNSVCQEVCTQGFCIRTDEQQFQKGKRGLCVLALDARTRAVTGSWSLGPGSFGRTGLDVSASGMVDLTVLTGGAVGHGRLTRTPEGRLEVSERLTFRPPLKGPPPEGSCPVPGHRQERFACTGRAPSPEVFDKARAACTSLGYSASMQTPPQGACSAHGCLTAVPVKKGALDVGGWCLAWVNTQGAVHWLPKPGVYRTAFQWDVRGETLCAHVYGGCKNREACLEETCFAAAPPHRLLLPHQRSPLESDGVYFVGPAASPVRVDGRLDDAAWGLAREVVAETQAHLRYGARAWSGPADSSIRFKLLHDADGMLLAARVRDDRVVPLAQGVPGVGTDHLELDFGTARYALLLGTDRKVALRQWRDRRGRDVDWPLESQCVWAPEDGGYALECLIPNGVIFYIPAVPGPSWFSVWVSDADQPGTQETLMGALLHEYFVSEVPPTLEEAHSIEQLKHARLP